MADGGELNLTDNGSEPVSDFYCELCREDGKMLEAEGYCVSCREYLCSTCYTHHRRTRSSRHHVLMDKEKMPKDTALSYDRVSKDITRICEHHAGEPVKYYCKSHNVLGCSICIVKCHRNCSNVESIPEMAESIMESHEYKEFIHMLNQCDQRASDNIKLVQDNLAKSKYCCLKVAKSLQRCRNEINSILDKLEKSILTQSDDLHKEEEEHLMSVSQEFTSSLELVEHIIGELSELQKSRKVCDLYIRLKESKREVSDIQAKLHEAEKGNVVREYVFDPNTELKKCLRSEHGLGKLSVQASVSAVGLALPHSNPINTKATHVTDTEVKSSKDGRDCCITGSAVVSNNRLIIVDHSNMKVKLLDTQNNKMISELTVSGRPWDVTVISRSQAAVTPFLSRHKILLLSVSDTLTLDKEITVGGQCYGVTYIKKRLVVTYTNPGKLGIMDLSGNVMKTVENDSDGHKLFNCPWYVCGSNDGDTMYVSDCGNNKVTSLNFDGEIKSVYSDSEFQSPMKVCVDKDDNVFVCCCFSRNVHMLTANLNKIKIILIQQDGLNSNVYAVSHCQETNRLFLGMWRNNKVKVYQLSQ